MPAVKQSPCCARVHARLVMEQANLRRLSQKTAMRASRGLSTALLLPRIEDAKQAVQGAKDAIVDHEADHAGGAR